MTTKDEALRVAREALERIVAWDKSRDFIVPYKVRDPIHAALRTIALAVEASSETTLSGRPAGNADECHAANLCVDAAVLFLTGDRAWPDGAMVLRDQFRAIWKQHAPAVQSVALGEPKARGKTLLQLDSECLQEVVRVSGFTERAKPDEDIVAYIRRIVASGAVGETAGKAENVEQILHFADIYGDARIMASRGRADRSEVDEARNDLRALVSRILGLPGTSNGQENGK